MSDETKKVSEAKGPYKRKSMAVFTYLMTEREVAIANAVHCEGFKAGRASRDGLREASQWAFEFFKARDEMNAKVHCSPTRLSPITERFMKALEADGGSK